MLLLKQCCLCGFGSMPLGVVRVICLLLELPQSWFVFVVYYLMSKQISSLSQPVSYCVVASNSIFCGYILCDHYLHALCALPSL